MKQHWLDLEHSTYLNTSLSAACGVVQVRHVAVVVNTYRLIKQRKRCEMLFLDKLFSTIVLTHLFK